MSKEIEIILQALRLAEDECLTSAIELLDGQDPSAELLGLRTELLCDAGQIEEAKDAIDELHYKDPWRADVERLWLAYRTGSATIETKFVRKMIGALDSRAPRIQARAAMALGKICSDHGALDLARSWLLGGLRLARDASDQSKEAAFAGALAEVLYLGGHPLEALGLLTWDDAMLRPGSRHRYRLMVYRSHCLRQIGELEAARSLCLEAEQAQLSNGGIDSWAIRSRLWCEALELGEVNYPFSDSTEDPPSHCKALCLLAQAWLNKNEVERKKTILEALEELNSAGSYPGEANWCVALLGEPFRPSHPKTPIPFSHIKPMVCDTWIGGLKLESLQERRYKALEHFKRSDPKSGISWMGVFF